MKLKLLFIPVFIISLVHAQVTVTLNSMTPSCSQPCNGALSFTASGGTGPYTYTLTPNSQSNTNGSFSNLCAGSFTVTVVDAVGASATLSSSVSVISQPVITTVNTTAISPPMNYRAEVFYTGGQPRYFVTWLTMPSMAIIRVDTVSTLSDTISQLVPGDYGVFVSDSLSIAHNCLGNPVPYQFSICDLTIGSSDLTVSPNDTVCSGTAITITYTPILFGPVALLTQIFSSDNASCDPSQSNGTFSCNITQTTTFSGAWFYAMNCGPIPYNPLTVTVLTCTGTNEISNTIPGLSIFPNPAKETLTFQVPGGGKMMVTITDAEGRICCASMVESGKQIDSGLSAGIYFCRVETENAVTTKKLVITE